MRKESSKRLHVAETKIRTDYTASAAQTELSIVANCTVLVEAQGNDVENIVARMAKLKSIISNDYL